MLFSPLKRSAPTETPVRSRPAADNDGYSPIDVLHEDDTVRVQVADGEGDFVLVAFTGVGHAMGGIDVQKPEFLSMCRFGKVFWVTDKQRSWGNGLDMDFIAGLIRKATGQRPIYCIGNSMGGFLAILFSRALGAKQVLAFAPQWSVHPAVVPKEKRWKEYRAAIPAYRYLDLSGAFTDTCRYAVIGGDHKLERMHMKFFPSAPNIERVELKKLKHDVAADLKAKGVLGDLLTGFFGEERPAGELLRAGGIRLR